MRNGTVTVREDDDPPPRYAFLGVRPCDLRAVAVQGWVLTGGAYADSVYGLRRASAFPVVAECTELCGRGAARRFGRPCCGRRGG
ncbi:hypothetical protein [Kitasatospora cathayae]|uniref:Uncharacterized protein n=1 Tax=Kitasatospora cathayae TaxID=3004092 RepID=A0ABY7PXF6_9ACTN|nr:hypothetical protein [Kitasatospora sp. HUAS 3-15]WBP84651.1 hypothetical protein O1G21_01475 [Kitasatospora sp. HUAS 3-15]